MEETITKPLGFNKRRAEGKDNNDKPKTYQLKVRKLNPVNTISYIQILGTGMDTQDTSPSILLFFDKQRFIFNAGEGLQRYCTEHRIKLSKIDHIFLSRVCSETAGGLPGLLLTLAGMGEEGMSVNISGPSDLQYLVDAMKSFIPNNAVHTRFFVTRPGSDVATYSGLEKSSDYLIDDEVVKISAILLKPRRPVVCQHKDSTKSVPSFMGSNEESGRTMGSLTPHSGPTLKPGDVSVIYVCELPEIKGKFDPSKARALGLNPGPKYRELQLGNSVESDKQNIIVHPTDVLGPSVPGPVVLLVDCPTLSHLQELVDIQSLNRYYSDQQLDGAKFVNCVIHLSPSSVTTTVMYQTWMKRFRGAQHIMAGHEIKNMEIPILKASARVATRLNYLCPQFFPAPGFLSLEDLYVQDPNVLSEGSGSELCDSISGENLLKFQLRPYTQLGLNRSGIPSMVVQKEIVNELISEVPEIVDSVEHVRQLWNESTTTDTIRELIGKDVVMAEKAIINGDASFPSIKLGLQNINSGEGNLGLRGINMSEDNHECDLPRSLENISREDMEIVLLGTGSSQPSKYRNVSSIFLNLFSKGGLLLDCGEGTLGQLKRRYGVKGADDVLRSLRCIWISHIHADHHTGLTRILARRCEMLRGVPHDPLLVIGPKQLKRFLDAYQRLEDLDMQFLDCSHTTKASLIAFENTLELSGNAVDSATQLRSMKNLKILLQEACLEALISIPVVHCPHAFGVVVKAAERSNITGKIIPGWKFVYSGDTRPCEELVDAARGATVLLHEATFEDGMVDEAIARNHSTTKEAIEVGNAAGAYRIILTHFSQRYPKIPVFDETHMHKTCIGFDLMSINLADLPVLPKVLPYLKLLFRNDIIADEPDNTESSLL